LAGLDLAAFPDLAEYKEDVDYLDLQDRLVSQALLAFPDLLALLVAQDLLVRFYQQQLQSTG